MKLPLKMPWELAQTRWASILEPIINFAVNQSGQSGKVLSTDGFQTKWIPASEVTGIIGISSGGTGQITQAAAITALAGTQSSGHYLRSNGSTTVLSAIQAGDVPTLNQSTTGTAANITATSNSTLTTLSSLSLSGSQVTGDIAGNASNITATTNSTLTTLSSLSLPVSQLSGAIAIGNGGTGQTTQTAGFDALSPLTTAGDVLTYGSGHNIRLGTGIGDVGKVLTSGGGLVSNNWSLVSLTASVSGTLPIGNGGTGNTTANTALNALLPSQSSNSGKLLTTDGTNTSWVTWSAPTIQKFTSGSGTYTTPAGVKWIRVRMVGGGGGGGGSGTASGGTGGTGGSTTFGSSLLTAAGGTGGPGANGSLGGAGGTGTATGLTALTITGGNGHGSSTNGGTAGIFQSGASGGNSVFGGAGQSGIGNAAGQAATTNTGGGGQSGGTSSAINFWTGAGGGAGGFVDAIITNPSATYAFAVGTAGTAGTLGTSGFAGGAGGSGLIIVEEYYQ